MYVQQTETVQKETALRPSSSVSGKIYPYETPDNMTL